MCQGRRSRQVMKGNLEAISVPLECVMELAESLGEAGSSCSRASAMTAATPVATRVWRIAVHTAKYSATVAESVGVGEAWRLQIAKCRATTPATAVAKSLGGGGVRPYGIAKYRTTTESELARPSGEDGPPESRANCPTSAVATAVGMSVGEVRPPCFMMYSAMTKSELAESSVEESGGAGPSGSRAHGTTSADDTAVVKFVGQAWPPGFAKYAATSESESELAESGTDPVA